MPQTKITQATVNDCSEILEFIKLLAEYEKLSHEVEATAEKLSQTLFGTSACARVLFFEENGVKVGMALYFYNYSTFLAKPGIYLEDLFIKIEHRGKGYGKKLLLHLAKLAVDNNCGRLEWSVLDWNTPALDFYKSLGSIPQSEWTAQRLTGETLLKLAQDSQN